MSLLRGYSQGEKKKINENYEPGKNWKNNPREKKCQKANHNTLKIQELKC